MVGSSSFATVLTRSFFTVLAIAVCPLLTAAGHAPLSPPEMTKTFPSRLGDFSQVEPARQILPGGRRIFQPPSPTEMPLFVGEATYASSNGERLRVAIIKWDNDSKAYADLTEWSAYERRQGQPSELETGKVGTASSLTNDGMAFFKGPVFVTITSDKGSNPNRAELARLFAATLDEGEGDIPVLVKHLPNWDTAQHQAVYALSSDALVFPVPNQPILTEVSFDGGTEAVIANYGQSQLVIVEFTTPQFSVDNDQRIWTRIAELKSQGQPTPTAYRRIGNYSVFVFNAPDEKTANALVDQVKYEKVVQWLGDDPHLYERLQRYLAQTSAGVLVAVLKSSGLSLVLCLVAGALIGTMLFRHRRAQKAAAYSDAGGSIRLNLDELTGPADTRRLLKSARSSEEDSLDS
jgi:hypothetical protein